MKRVLLILMVALLAVPVTYAQEAEDAAEEAAVEAAVELPTKLEALEAAPAAPAGVSGFTVGLNVAMPVIAGEFYDNPGNELKPVFGVVIGTPYGIPLGPLNIGLNAGIESANGLTGIFGILNAGIDAISEKVGFPVAVFGGFGLLEGLGIIGGVSLDYPMDPVVIKPYFRGTISTAGAGGLDGAAEPTGWIQVGAMVSYAL